MWCSPASVALSKIWFVANWKAYIFDRKMNNWVKATFDAASTAAGPFATLTNLQDLSVSLAPVDYGFLIAYFEYCFHICLKMWNLEGFECQTSIWRTQSTLFSEPFFHTPNKTSCCASFISILNWCHITSPQGDGRLDFIDHARSNTTSSPTICRRN